MTNIVSMEQGYIKLMKEHTTVHFQSTSLKIGQLRGALLLRIRKQETVVDVIWFVDCFCIADDIYSLALFHSNKIYCQNKNC